MSLTREDMLRELELLPVWRLNAPLETSLNASLNAPLEAKQEAAPSDAPVVPQLEPMLEAKAEVEAITSVEVEAAVEVKEMPDQAEEASIAEASKAEASKEAASQAEATQAPALPDIANMDWAALKQYVAGTGDQNADWVFVNDAPFESDASALLDKMLIAIQLQRGKNVYLTQLSEPEYFKRQIALIQPKLIVAFGEKTAQTLLGSNEPLDALRGTVHQYQGVSVIASYAPSHLLQRTQDKAKAWADLCLARDTMNRFNEK
jgi:DNA polymerase